MNLPKSWLDIEGLVDSDGRIEGKQTGMIYDPAESKIEIYLNPDVRTEGPKPVAADGSGD